MIFNVKIGKDLVLKNSVFHNRTALTEIIGCLCIFSFTVFIVNEYVISVAKLRICAHHLLLAIILNILKCVTLCHLTISWVVITPSNLYKLILILKGIETGHLLIENVVKIIFVTSLSVSLHNLLDFYIYVYICLYMYIYIYIYIYIQGLKKTVNDQSYGVLDRYGLTILYN